MVKHCARHCSSAIGTGHKSSFRLGKWNQWNKKQRKIMTLLFQLIACTGSADWTQELALFNSFGFRAESKNKKHLLFLSDFNSRILGRVIN